MAKNCLICGKKIGLLSSRLTIKDGYVCLDCAEQYGVNKALDDGIAFQDIEPLFTQVPLSKIDEPASKLRSLVGMWESFEPTYRVDKYALFDDNHRTLMVARSPMLANFTLTIAEARGSTSPKRYMGYTLLYYDDIIGYDLLEDGESQIKGGLGRAVAGGVLFGQVGAVVGGVTGKRKSNNVCTSLKLKLILRDRVDPSLYLPLITSATKTKSIVYKSAMKSAQNIISKLQIIDAERQEDANTSIEGRSLNAGAIGDSPVEELRRYKALVDEGILTEEEYVAKKKQILGI